MNEQNFTRRTFCKLTVGTVVAAPIVNSTIASAGGHLPKIEESDPQAMALGYLHDATAVDGSKHANYADGQVCSNCVLYQGKEGDDWGPCGVFPGKEVAAGGWCTAYNKKT